MQAPNLHIVVLAYKNFDRTTLRCLESLLPQSSPLGIPVLVGDNGSPDDGAECLARYISNKKLSEDCLQAVYFSKNHGYPGGMNRLVALTHSEWVLLVGSDTIFSEGSLAAFVHALPALPNTIGIIGPVTNHAGTAQKLFFKSQSVDEMMVEWREETKIDYPLVSPLIRADFFCVSIRKRAWDRLQGLDEGYGRGYYEDVDFCIRARAIGYRSAMIENVFVFHEGSASFSKDLEIHELIKRNKKRFQSIHPGVDLLHIREDLLRTVHGYLNSLPERVDAPTARRIQNRLSEIERQKPKGPLKRLVWQAITFKLKRLSVKRFPYHLNQFYKGFTPPPPKGVTVFKNHATSMITLGVPSSHLLCNPSLLKTPQGWSVLVRDLLPMDPTAIDFKSSDNYLLSFTEDFSESSIVRIEDTPIRKTHPELRNGLEDGRIFLWKGQVWGLFSGYQISPDGQSNTMCLVNLSKEVIEDVILLPSPRSARREKNWLPWVMEGKLYLIYTVCPIEIYEVRDGNLKAVLGLSTQVNTIHKDRNPLSGSSAVIPWHEDYLAVIHQRRRMPRLLSFYKKFISKDPLYKLQKIQFQHRFVRFNHAMELKSISNPFVFEIEGIEFCAGLAHHQDKVYLSYGLFDWEAKCLTIPTSTVDSLFE